MPSERPSVIFMELPGRKPIGTAVAMNVAAKGWDLICVSGTAQALEAIKGTPDARVLVSNDPDVSLFEANRQRSQSSINILVTDLPMQEYCEAMGHRDLELLDHVIANIDADWTATELAITLQKIIRRDIFGIEKYLHSGTSIQSRIIKGSTDREPTNKLVQEWVENCGLGKNIARMAYGICEELMMNAIYDAPIAGGRAHYETKERTSKWELAPDEWSTLKFGVDGRLFAISITDPFGAFLKDRWFSYMRKALKRNDSESLIDQKKGGAGLGLFKMLYSSHGVVCNVDPGKMTEVIILIALQRTIRDFVHMPRSIHYFSTEL